MSPTWYSYYKSRIFGKSFPILFLTLLAPAPASAAPLILINNDQSYKVHQPRYKFDFWVYRTNDIPDAWFRTYDGYLVTRRADQNWVYGKLNGQAFEQTDILVGSVNPAEAKELKSWTRSTTQADRRANLLSSLGLFSSDLSSAGEDTSILLGLEKPSAEEELASADQSHLFVRPGKKPGDPPRVFDFNSPESEYAEDRAWDEIPWTIPPEEKVDFAERIYTTMRNALNSRRSAYMLYGEPLDIRNAWQPSNLFKEVPFPGDWGQSITWANDKRGILWWSKWHVFGISTYGSRVLGSWILDSGYGYHDTRVPMADFWRWYDQRILLFNHFFKKEPVHDDEMAIWVLNEKYLFILIPNIEVSARGVGDIDKLSQQVLNPLEWIRQPFILFRWVSWFFGWRPTNKQLLYYMIKLPEVPDEVTLNQTLRALRMPMRQENIYEARGVENANAAAEMEQMRRERQRQEEQE